MARRNLRIYEALKFLPYGVLALLPLAGGLRMTLGPMFMIQRRLSHDCRRAASQEDQEDLHRSRLSHRRDIHKGARCSSMAKGQCPRTLLES